MQIASGGACRGTRPSSKFAALNAADASGGSCADALSVPVAVAVYTAPIPYTATGSRSHSRRIESLVLLALSKNTC